MVSNTVFEMPATPYDNEPSDEQSYRQENYQKQSRTSRRSRDKHEGKRREASRDQYLDRWD